MKFKNFGRSEFVGNDVLFILVISSIQQSSKMGEKNKRDNEMRRELMEGM